MINLSTNLEPYIGELAGTIWHKLDTNRTMGQAELKACIVGQSLLVDFAIGWLAREGKVELLEENTEIKIRRTAHS